MAQYYDNFVLEQRVQDYLSTKLGMSQFLTLDSSLTEAPGMKKFINTYKKNGVAEDVAEGAGNANLLSVSYEPKEYDVKVAQATFKYSDEQMMKDPYYVDKGVEAVAESLINKFTKEAIEELRTGSLEVAVSTLGYEAVVDALAELNLESGEDAGYMMLVSPKGKAEIQKNLAGQLMYVEAFARTGYVGSLCGIPIYVSKAFVEDDDCEALIVSPEAVRCFVKKSPYIEQSRDIEKRQNTVVGGQVYVIALVNDDKVVRIKRA